MVVRIVVFCVLLVASEVSLGDTLAELENKLQQMMQDIQQLRNEVDQLRAESNPDRSAAAPSSNGPQDGALVDLNERRVGSINAVSDAPVVEKPWWQNVDIYGFGAAGYYDTGSAATRDDGGFEIKEASIFLEADVWDDVAFFLELQTNRLGKDDDLFTRTGEVYIHFRDLFFGEESSMGLKIGRIDIPFGEEYLWQDAIDNPLITNSAAYPYGWDEGLLLYGNLRGFNWIAAVTDGTDARSKEENSDKAFNVKAYGSPLESLYLSLSLMTNGDGTKSAVEFGGSHFQPVGASHVSTLGTSPSTEVDAHMAELNAKYSFSVGSRDGYLALSAGAAKQDDPVSIFDRDIFWFSVEPFIHLNSRWYAVMRYSEIGTYDNTEGFHFDGKTFAGGNSTFGYDTERFRRLGVGVGWTPNPHVKTKLELGKDWFDLIDLSTLPDDDSRNFLGLEVAVRY